MNCLAVLVVGVTSLLRCCCCAPSAWTTRGAAAQWFQAGTTGRRTVTFLDRAAAP